MRSPGVPLIAVLLAVGASGCAAVGPDFTPPVAPKQTVMLGERVTAEWWTLFRSPDLDQLVKQAIAGSHTLESANARLAQARETVMAASSALYLQLGVNAGVAQQRLSATSFGLGPNAFPLPPSFTLYQVGPTASYAHQQLSVARHTSAVLLGRAPGDWSPPDFDLAALTLPSQLPVSLPSELVHQRPDIQAAEAQLHAASAQIGIATAQLYPAITLSAGLSVTALDLGQLFNPAGLVWNIAAGLAQPLGTASVAESVRLQRISYTGGGSGILELLDAQRQYQQALLGYVQAEAQRYQDTIQLLVAMGGGRLSA